MRWNFCDIPGPTDKPGTGKFPGTSNHADCTVNDLGTCRTQEAGRTLSAKVDGIDEACKWFSSRWQLAGETVGLWAIGSHWPELYCGATQKGDLRGGRGGGQVQTPAPVLRRSPRWLVLCRKTLYST